ncbi:MAG: four helix bundle protein [Planctomycetes bacterium]|jgi:four helix bundle protein|nr:four helix bundle protein [Phycisphaerae bacterium]NBB96058.1 four helix bundle protein [Planctomycetota bacterium]
MADGFEELEVYRQARLVRKRIYKLSRQLPKDEQFNLISQMQRAALSLTNNIAEGHGTRSWRHNVAYLYRSRGSANELLDDLNGCEGEGYFQNEHLDDLRDDLSSAIRLINGYVRYRRDRLRDDT